MTLLNNVKVQDDTHINFIVRNLFNIGKSCFKEASITFTFICVIIDVLQFNIKIN